MDNHLLVNYFQAGYKYSVIQLMLGVFISLRSLKRKLHDLGLRRRGSNVQEGIVRHVIQRELQSSGSLLGYRSMHVRLRLDYQLNVSREKVRKILKALDPVGVAMRKKRRLVRRKYFNKGPDFCWHLDGCDKLVPFGFALHGCIDGFSRKLLWLEMSPTNKDSKVVAGYFLKAVEKFGCPRIIRADRGSENVKVAFMQPFLRRNGTDSHAEWKSFHYGRSVSNQRIEQWWSLLKKWCLDFWIDLFKSLRSEGLYDDSNVTNRDSLKFAFYSIIQEDIEKVMKMWNNHYLRKSTHSYISGIPNQLYYLPEINGHRGYSNEVDSEDFEVCKPYSQSKPEATIPEFKQLAHIIMDEESLSMPRNVKQALELYLTLINALN